MHLWGHEGEKLGCDAAAEASTGPSECPLEMSLVEAGRTGLCINPSLAEEMVPMMEHLQEELGCKHQQPALQAAGQ